jgi:predicted kinase
MVRNDTSFTLGNGTLTLMVGIPGSGKSTVARSLSDVSGAEICSTDDYWYQDDPTVYTFDVKRLGEAHRWNQQRAASFMAAGQDVIIDNTNLDDRSREPYYALASIYNFDVVVVTVDTPVNICIARQVDRPEDRRVPPDVIRKMWSKLRGYDDYYDYIKAEAETS